MKAKKESNKVDLHVHTPASSDYRGPRGREGFIELLKAYKEADVTALALTDHNTINGFRQYLDLKEETKLNYNLNYKREANSEFVDVLKDEMMLFNSLAIIPGVEISCFPSVHLILIFVEDIDLDTVDTFLTETIGLGADAVGSGNPDKVSVHSPTAIIEKARDTFGSDFFVILPHVDSSKGAWKELKDCGSARAELIRMEEVLCAQIVNPQSKSHIENALSQPQYERVNPLAFIQASDYHGGASSQAASQYCKVYLEDYPSFKTLSDAFRNKNELKMSSDFVDEEIEHYCEDAIVLSFDFQNTLEISSERKGELAQALCAALNSDESVLRFDVLNLNANSRDLSDKLSGMIDELALLLDPFDSPSSRIVYFQHSQNRQTFLITFRNRNIRLHDGKVLIPSKQGQVRVAKAWEIEQRVAQNFYAKYGKPKQIALESSAEDLLMISSALPAFSIATRINQKLNLKLNSVFKRRYLAPAYDSKLKDNDCYNGVSDGEYYMFQPGTELKGGRQTGEEADYFRFTTPSFGKGTAVLPETKDTPNEVILAIPGGGVTYCNKSKPIYAPFPILMMQYDNENEEFSLEPEEVSEILLGLTCYLKSSFFLWYVTSIHQTNEVAQLLSMGMPIPMPEDFDLFKALANFGRNTMLSEVQLLKRFETPTHSKKQEKELGTAIQTHNKATLNNMRLIDKEVSRWLGLNENDIREIYRVINQLNIYDYGIGSDLDSFIKETRK